MHAGAQVCFQHDFQVFRWLCGAVLPGWSGLLDALERQVLTEFDYRQEAESLQEVRDNLSRSPYRWRVCVPAPMKELCSKNVLVMEMLHGQRLVDSIKDGFAAALGWSSDAAQEFMVKRRHEVMTGEDAGSRACLRDSTGPLGKIRLLFLLRKCRNVVICWSTVTVFASSKRGRGTAIHTLVRN